jgi:3-hydroxy-9,10-secoandrosta-1,3,5(10)-triene-9,17-dione monooxygenase
VDSVLVPDHHLLSLHRVLTGEYAADHPDEPLYGHNPVSLLALTLLSPVLGMTDAALEHTMRLLKSGRFCGKPLFGSPTGSPSLQLNIADAASRIDTARLHAFRAIGDIERGIREGVGLDLDIRARIRMDIGTAVRHARSAVRLLLDVGGPAGFRLGRPVQRIWRDLEQITRYELLSADVSREIYGRTLLGIQNQATYLI